MKLVTTQDSIVHGLALQYPGGGEALCTLDAQGEITEGKIRDVTCRQCQASLRKSGWRKRWPATSRKAS